MLENKHARGLADWRALPFRPPALAGRAYPANPQQLWQQLAAYSKAAGQLQAAAVDWAKVAGRGIGLLSPHIDYPRGSAVYAQLWQRAAQAPRQADLVIMFGTDHQGYDPFTLTRQHYATPYGVLPTATAIVDQLAEAIGPAAAFAGELRHRGEHSLELPTVWLHHLRNGEPVETVPILVGGFQRFLPRYTRSTAGPAGDAQIEAVLRALQTASAGRRVLVLASGDLAHVGPAFGGAALNATTRSHLRADDEALLQPMRAGNAEGFWAAIRQVQDGNNVCGVAPIYLTMRLLQPTSGEQVGYATCPADAQNTSVVTVAGMLFQ